MARVAEHITRDVIATKLKEAKEKKKPKKDYIRQELMRENPGIETLTIVRNGSVYNVLDYLMEDLESYGGE
jgi:hypothetical protein